MDAATAYFLKKYYPHVIKWWLVVYNPEVIKIWPSKEEKEEALLLEEKEAEKLALEGPVKDKQETKALNAPLDASAFNATTGSYSGLYGQKPVDAQTQLALDAIMTTSSNQNNIDNILAGGAVEKKNKLSSSTVVEIPPEQDDIIEEANAIYERLLREAAEDEAKKQAEIEAAKLSYST